MLYVTLCKCIEGCIKFIESGSKDIYKITKDFYLPNAVHLNFLDRVLLMNRKNVSQFPEKREAAQWFSTQIIVRNVS